MSALSRLVEAEFVALLVGRADVATLADAEVGRILWRARQKYGANLSEAAVVRVLKKAREEVFKRLERGRAERDFPVSQSRKV